MNRIAKIVSNLILGSLLLMGILTFLLPQRDYSENENRTLTQLPAFSAAHLLDGSYQDDLTDYLSDQFPLRDHWMMTATRIRLLTGQHDIGDTYIGKDHYYFEKILDSDIDLNTYTKNLARVDSLAEDFPEMTSCLLLVPSAGNILTDKLPDYAEMYDSDALYTIAEEQLTQIMLVNPTSQLRAAAACVADSASVSSDDSADNNTDDIVEDNTGTDSDSETDDSTGSNADSETDDSTDSKTNADCFDSLYYRTDHHWTAWGAFIGYQALTQKARITIDTETSTFTENSTTTENSTDSENSTTTESSTYSSTNDNTLENISVGNYTIYQAETVSDDFLGTLYSRTLDSSAICDSIDLPIVSDDIVVTIDGESAELYDLSCLSEKDQYQVYLGGNHGLVEISNCNGKGTLLIIKDSFANCLVPYLTEDYETIIMIDLRYYSGSVRQYLQEHSVDALLVIYELSNFAEDTSLAKLAL